MKVYSFPHGGIDFDDPTAPVWTSSKTAFLPNFAVIPLVQFSENRVQPVVAVGDTVTEGMLIGRRHGPGSSNIHATVPGRVVRIVSWQAAESYVNQAIVLRTGGSFDKLGKPEQVFKWDMLSPQELHELITEYGIVEMDGTGLPLSDALSALPKEGNLSVIVNCVFDDPWLVADYVLCKERLSAVVEGALIIQKITGANQIVYVISHTQKQLLALFQQETNQYVVPSFFVQVRAKYPQRNRRQLDLVLKIFEKEENIHLDTLFIQGPSTLAAVHDAVKLRKPILDRYVAVGGSAVQNPSVLKVRIGTMFEEVFDQCGGFIDDPIRIATGSPLRGRKVVNLNEPITKNTTAVFALLKKQVGVTSVRTCISCGECRSVCPVRLDPERLFKSIRGAKQEKAASRIAECLGCGCCEVVCPSRLPLSTILGAWNKAKSKGE
ncbi:MAG: RnfABCDGE type electron transport complex subunit C [Spirochaetaceae bacterium]|jgi:electron transport complex protein RnfC|nr:RnfABCDGE type electron transport complex subunit C [Spirochaetaceae bacterium]